MLRQALAHAAQAVAGDERFGAGAVVARLDGDAALDAAGIDPQVARAGMAHRVRDDFLRAAQQHVRALGIVEGQRLLDVHVDRERRDVFGEGPQCGGEVDRPALAQLADRFAHVGQQQARERVRLLHVFLHPPVGQMARDFEVEAERGEVVAEQVVQFARDARALVDARAFGEQRARGAQFGIQPSLFFARLRLLPRDEAGDEHEAREARVQHRLHQALRAAGS